VAGVVTGANLMSHGDNKSKNLTTATRVAKWILPPHRKDWADAMLNEIAYIKSRRAAVYWILGCTLSAVRERTSYELEKTPVSHRILRTVLGLGAASVIAVVGIYIVQKPYQRERISITIHRAFEHGQSQVRK